MYSYSTYSDLYTEAVNKFNFCKVRLVMKELSWKWATSKEGVPSIEEMKTACKRLFDTACDFDSTTSVCSSGGFKVTVCKEPDEEPLVRIEFVLEQREEY
jgi:hypothetical protein